MAGWASLAAACEGIDDDAASLVALPSDPCLGGWAVMAHTAAADGDCVENTSASAAAVSGPAGIERLLTDSDGDPVHMDVEAIGVGGWHVHAQALLHSNDGMIGPAADGMDISGAGGDDAVDFPDDVPDAAMLDAPPLPPPLALPPLAAAPGIVSAAEIRTLLADQPRVFQGSPLLRVIADTLPSAMADEAERSEAIENLARETMLQRKSPGTSWESIAEKAETNRRTVAEGIQLLASSLVETERASRAKFEACVRSAVGFENCLMYLDMACYDETSMPVVAQEMAASSELLRHANAVPLLALPDSDEALVVPELPMQSFDAAKLKAKLVQSEQKFAMLVRLPPAEDEDRYCVIFGVTINWLQRVERTTGGCMQDAMERVCGVSAAANDFGFKLRFACTDDAASNDVAERGVVANRGDNWHG